VLGLSRGKAAQATGGGQRPAADGGSLPPNGEPRAVPERFGVRAFGAVLLVHCVPVLLLFGRAFAGWLLYFRDLSTTYAPWYAFTAESLRRGVWPLWNPTAHAGEPFLLAYPVDLALLLIGGWRAPLGVGAALHLLLALAGGSWLARRLGMGAWGAWLAGTVYGLGGTLLSLLNLVQLFEAAAWAPWVVAAFVGLMRRPSARRAACLALLAAVQATTLGAEIVLQTVLVALVLSWSRGWLDRRRLAALFGASALAATLAAPALLGARALLADTARERGFALGEALSFSAHPVTLAEIGLPLWLGNPRAFSDADYWGRVYFPEGYPYLLTLYLGVPVLLLAAQSRRPRRLWALAALGLLLALGSYGPLGLLPAHVRLPLRGPLKLIWITHLALALLAGFGLERRLAERGRGLRGRWTRALPGAAFVLLALAVSRAPEIVLSSAARLIPELLAARASLAARSTWPAAWLLAGSLAMVAGLALVRAGRWSRVAALAAAIDLLAVNASVATLAPASFYALRRDVAGLVASARDAGRGRIFSYGIAGTPDLRFEPTTARATSDVWLYYLDRQSLLPLTHVLDGWDGALSEDRTGLTPRDAALDPAQAVPARFREYSRRLQQAGVRWVMSFDELPADLVVARGHLKLPEIIAPLGLYEVRGVLPRAFFVAERELVADPERARRILEDAAFDPARVVLLESDPNPPPTPEGGASSEASVRYEPVDAHTIRVTARTAPGYLVILDGFHREWTAEEGSAPVPVLRADGRYRALHTSGGERVFTLRFRPRWRGPALLATVAGLVICVLLLIRGGRGPSSADPATSRVLD
jgi:hypothetical protein